MIKLYMYKPLEKKEDVDRLFNYMDSKIWWSKLDHMNDAMELGFKIKRATPKEILNCAKLLDGYFEAFQQFEKIEDRKHIGLINLKYIFEKYREYQPKNLTKELLRAWLQEKNVSDIFKKSETFFKSDPDLENLGIICLSKDPDSIPMWGHYATNGKGYCLEYELNEKTNAKHAIEGRGCFWYDFKLATQENAPLKKGEVHFWVERGKLKCKLENLNGTIKHANLSFHLKNNQLSRQYLDLYKNEIIEELTRKKLINRLSKFILYEINERNKQFLLCAEIKYQKEIPVLDEKQYFYLTSSFNNETIIYEKDKKKINCINYAAEHSCFVKSYEWVYEKEFRFISNLNCESFKGASEKGQYQPLNEHAPLRLNGVIIGENFGISISRIDHEKYKNADMLKQEIFKVAKSKQLVVYSSKRDIDSSIYRMKHTQLE